MQLAKHLHRCQAKFEREMWLCDFCCSQLLSNRVTFCSARLMLISGLIKTWMMTKTSLSTSRMWLKLKEEVQHFSNIGPKGGLMSTELTSIHDFCVFEKWWDKMLNLSWLWSQSTINQYPGDPKPRYRRTPNPRVPESLVKVLEIHNHGPG